LRDLDDAKGGPWEWRSRVVHLVSEDDADSTAKLNDVLGDKTLLAEGFSVNSILTAETGAGQYSRNPVAIVLFRRRKA